MLKRFMKEKNGQASTMIIVLAVVVGIALAFFGYLKLTSQSQIENSEQGVDYVLEKVDTPPTMGTGKVGDGARKAIADGSSRKYYAMAAPKIKVSPDIAFHYYGVNEVVDIQAIPQEGNGYTPKAHFACEWAGIEYTGDSCNLKNVRLKVGENEIKVTLCDARKACADAAKTISVEYRDPMLIMHEEWSNYVVSGASGEWKYDEASKTIHSTKNVNWTGYWNPDDKELTDYTLTFKMAVTKNSGDDDAIGFTFRQTDNKNFYFLSLDNRTVNGGAVHSGIYKDVNGKRTRLVDLIPLKWETGKWINVKIQVEGTIIMVWIDGEMVTRIDDSSHKKGGYGPFSYSQAYAGYKDLQITFP